MKTRVRNVKHLRATAICVAFLLASRQTVNQPHRTDVTGVTTRADRSSNQWSLNEAKPRRPNWILLVAQGSGCAPAHTNANIQMLADAAPGFATLAIENYGVARSSGSGPEAGCSVRSRQRLVEVKDIAGRSCVISAGV